MKELRIISIDLFGQKSTRIQIGNDLENSKTIKEFMSKKKAIEKARELFNIENIKDYKVLYY